MVYKLLFEVLAIQYVEKGLGSTHLIRLGYHGNAGIYRNRRDIRVSDVGLLREASSFLSGGYSSLFPVHIEMSQRWVLAFLNYP